MFCPKCGSEVSNSAAQCPTCCEVLTRPRDAVQTPSEETGETPQTNPAMPKLQTYMSHAIIVTAAPIVLLCCCTGCFGLPAFPVGIVAIVFASQANSKLAAGDLAGAEAAAKNAKLWCLIAGGILVLAMLISMIVLAIQIAAGGLDAALRSHKTFGRPW